MEFERAIYRVYERSMEGIRDTDNADIGQKYCKIFEYIALVAGVILLLCLTFLHLSFVGSPGCLPSLLLSKASEMNISRFSIEKDQILAINVAASFSPSQSS